MKRGNPKDSKQSYFLLYTATGRGFYCFEAPHPGITTQSGVIPSAAQGFFEGIECWSARELQELFGYSKWENFEKVIQKAKDACNNVGERDNYHFPDIRKTIAGGIHKRAFEKVNVIF